MRRTRLYALSVIGILLIAVAVLVERRSRSGVDLPVLQIAGPTELAPPCPWREPEADLQLLFPTATRYQTQTNILSGRRVQLAQRLGRMPTGDENFINLYRAYAQQDFLGTVMTRRVKGEFGAIELVLAVNTNRAVIGLRLQRLREPDAVASALTNAAWLAGFRRKTADSQWKVGQDLPDVSPEARPSAEAVAAGVRSLLILLDTAEQAETPVAHKHHKP